jgi:hypothetical protein
MTGLLGSATGGATRMARFWKEPYTLERALALGIRDFENAPVVGVPNQAWVGRPEFRDWPEWICYVEVCRFTFAFFSLDMIREYLGFYSRKVLPSSRLYGASPFSQGAAASVGDGQTRFERLPLWLRQESKRVRVVKALEQALQVFGSEG